MIFWPLPWVFLLNNCKVYAKPIWRYFVAWEYADKDWHEHFEVQESASTSISRSLSRERPEGHNGTHSHRHHEEDVYDSKPMRDYEFVTPAECSESKSLLGFTTPK